MKRISLLGSTGSIGVSALDVVDEHRDQFQVVALAAGRNLDLLIEQIIEFQPQFVSVADEKLAGQLKSRLVELSITLPKMPEIAYGKEGLLQAAIHPEADTVLTAVVGVKGLEPTLAATKAGKRIALANKEPLVAAGHLVRQAAESSGAEILPVDSEHSAIFQCLRGERAEEVNRLILTSSGGPFRKKSRREMESVSIEDALQHPTWSMGAKITIDSATLMNKGLEVIEAHWLFQLPFSQISVLVHPQSIVHSMVEFVDGSVLAQLGTTDMRLPIQFALSFPDRVHTNRDRLDFTAIGALTFEEPDLERFPCLRICYEAGAAGGTAPCVVNAANEMANSLFLEGKIPFLGIETLIRNVLDQHQLTSAPTLEDVIESDQWARLQTLELSRKLESGARF